MLPHEHFIFGLILSGILFLTNPNLTILGLIIIVLSTVLVDIDHYLFYAIKKKDLSLKNAYKWYTGNKIKTQHLSRKEKEQFYFGFHFLHGIEMLILLYLLYNYVNKIFLYVLIGYSLHFLLDLLVEILWCGRTDKISIIYSFLRGRKLKFIDEFKI